MSLLCKHHQLVLDAKVAKVIVFALTLYCAAVILVNWDPKIEDNYSYWFILIGFSFFCLYVIYPFLSGKEMLVLLASFGYDENDWNIAFRWFWFIFCLALLILLPLLASSLAK